MPTPTKLTVEPLTAQTELVDDVTEKTVPLPDVAKPGLKSPPLAAKGGAFVIATVALDLLR